MSGNHARGVDPYVTIEKRSRFRIPELYRRMRANGACDYGSSPESASTALGGALDFEWLPLDAMASWSPPDYWHTDHVFVPFGMSGSGDKYAWYPAWAEGDAVPIVFAYHDDNRCECRAPHFEGFLYREMLEALTFGDAKDADEDLSPDEALQARRADIDILRPYLRPSWISDLDAIVAREPKTWVHVFPRIKETHVSWLDDRELEERITRELAFSQLNAAFRHMR